MYQKKTELYGNNLPVGFLQNNIDEVLKIYNLPNNNKITKTLISQRIATANHRVQFVQGNGFPSTLLKIEDEFFNFIIEMSKCRHKTKVSK